MADHYSEPEITITELGNNLSPIIPLYLHMERKVKVGKIGKDPGELWCPHGVAINHISKLIFVAEGNKGFARVSIFSEDGEYLKSFTDEQMKCPFGIAFHNYNIYVMDAEAHGVFHFKMEADIPLVGALVGEGSSDGEFKFPEGIAVSDNGNIFIADTYNHRIQIFDEHLMYQRSITHDTVQSPNDVKVTSDEVFVLCFLYSPCLHVFSRSGGHLRSLITCGVEKQVSLPSFFCLDTLENIIIGDGRDKCIKVFAPNSGLLHTIRGFGSGFDVNPQGVALMDLKLVVVAPSDEFQLQICSI